MNELYQFENYKEFIRFQTGRHRHQRGYQGKLAEGAGCQRSFLSQVLNGPVHLTPDHAAGMAAFWQMDADATEYFLALLHEARAATPALHAHLRTRLGILRKKKEVLSERISQPRLEHSEEASVYYSNWYWAAIHLLCGIRKYQLAQAIAERLRLPQNLVHECLEGLSKMELIEKKEGRWVITQRSLHTPAESPNTWKHHMNWRQRALLNSPEVGEKALHYSGVHTLSVKDYHQLKQKVLDFVDETRQLIQPSPPEELVCLNIDLFFA